MVEWDGLENRFIRKGNEGSNPSLSALIRRSFSEGGSFTKSIAMWFVYMLKCSNGDIYKGCTEDIEERMARHNKGYVDATKNVLPVTLIGYFAITDKYKAYEFEKYLKSGSGRAFLSKHFL